MDYRSLADIRDLAVRREMRRIVMAAAEDLPVLRAMQQAVELKIADPVFVGNTEQITKMAAEIGFDIRSYDIYDETGSCQVLR